MYFSLYIFSISLTIGILPLISQYRNEIQLLKSQLLSKGGGGDGSNIDIAELERQKQSHAEEKESLILEKSLAENELGEEEERENNVVCTMCGVSCTAHCILRITYFVLCTVC